MKKFIRRLKFRRICYNRVIRGYIQLGRPVVRIRDKWSIWRATKYISDVLYKMLQTDGGIALYIDMMKGILK